MSKQQEIIKILCMSDIHGNKSLAEKILKHEKHDFSVFAGDSELNDEWVKKNFNLCVAGNNDFYSQLPDNDFVNISGFRIFVTHGHLFGSYKQLMTPSQLEIFAKKIKETDLFVYGHTHYPLFYQKDNESVAFLNPGSITYPRFSSTFSYAVITVDLLTKQIINVDFYDPTKKF
ncbi:metallophosphoesterase family protein [Mycoplasmopsis alligatoris]|uniref:Phosphoesterase n=1 Tax=Mycoplasmopsis alligatoris A21JP2 TaxID=747682 RepID=D4XVQ2_9BACT|nr:metallophosphoesterase [Mycoplasmopsis alligatoris]EFF41679.1 phosphodiesterase family protein [Mycoplasmopsis alligatoris A21JP2]